MNILKLFFLSILLTSCGHEAEIPNKTIVSVKMSNQKQGTYYLVKSSDAQDWKHYYKAQDSCKIDSLGNFQFTLNLTSADFLQIRDSEGFKIHEHELYLEPGDSLILAFDNDDLKLNGKAAQLNKLSWELDQWRIKNDSSNQRYSDRRYLEPKDFISYVNKVKKERESVIKAYNTQQPIPSKFNNYLVAEIQSQWTKDVFDYLKYHSYYAHDSWSYLSTDSLAVNVLDKWAPDSNYHFISNYWECVDGYVNHKFETSKLQVPDSLKLQNMFSDKFSIVKTNLSGINRDIGLLNLSQEYWRFLSLPENNFYEQAEIANKYFLLNKESEQYYDLFEKNFLAFLEISPGKKAPNFSLINNVGKEVSLSDFAGKVVYIDFWGTWCGPCIKAIPKHLELQESLKYTEDVVVLYIALEYDENDIRRWKKFVSDRNWPGIHLVAERQFQNEQLKPYKLSAAPTYVLIDKAGNIVNPRASGPGNILRDIERLLDK